jgi:DNA-binding LytR/AlgR family response regulator
VPLRGKGRTAFIPIGDICWIELLRNYTLVGLMNPGRILFFRRRLGEWEADLPTGLFERLGKSLVVQIALIQETEWKSRDQTVLTFAARPTLTESYVQAQRREAWGDPPPDAASSVMRPRPHGRSAFTSHTGAG